jgi:hypothetical protein
VTKFSAETLLRSSTEFPYSAEDLDNFILERATIKCWNFLVVTDLQARPIAWSKPFEGSRTDAFAAKGFNAFGEGCRHFKNEFIAGDLMFMNNAHCLTALKSNSVNKMVNKAKKLSDEKRDEEAKRQVEDEEQKPAKRSNARLNQNRNQNQNQKPVDADAEEKKEEDEKKIGFRTSN